MATRRQREERRERVSAARRVEEHRSGFVSTAFDCPDGIKMWSLKDACVKKFDVLPYRAGKGNKFADEGHLHFERTYFCHVKVGVNENRYICPSKTFNKPCPICEHRAKLVREAETDKDLLRDLLPKERQLFLVKDLEDNKIYLWDNSFHNFGKLLDTRVKTADDDDEYKYFADLETGLTLRVAFEEVKFGTGKPFLQASSIDFKPRKEQYDASLADEMPCLDDLLILKSYAELEKIYYQEADEADDDNEEDEKPQKAKTTSRPVVDDDDDDEPVRSSPKRKPVDDDDDDEPVKTKPKRKADDGVCVACEGTGVNSKGRPCLVCKGKNQTKPVASNDDDDDDIPVKPKQKPKPAEDDDEDDVPVKKPSKPKPVDEDDEDVPVKPKSKPKSVDDDEDDPPAKPKQKAKSKADDDDDNWMYDDE